MIVQELQWLDDAECRGRPTRIFFEDAWVDEIGAPGPGEAIAKAFCAACKVREQCLEYAQLFEVSHGIWGGLNPKERSALAKKSRKTP